MNPKADINVVEKVSSCGCHDDCRPPPASAEPKAAAERKRAALERTVLRIDKMDCPTEERLIRSRLGHMEGVDDLSFNLLQRELTVTHRLPSDRRDLGDRASRRILQRVSGVLFAFTDRIAEGRSDAR